MVKTADGTTDGCGKVIGDPSVDERFGADGTVKEGLVMWHPVVNF